MNEQTSSTASLYAFLESTGQVSHTIHIPARQGKNEPWPQWVSSRVLAALETRGITHAWTHQVRAAHSIHTGTHTVLASGTGSGKSLAAWIPILSHLCDYREHNTSLSNHKRPPYALYLSPTKALAADQHHSLTHFAADVNPGIHVALCDGDAPRDEREAARLYGDIVLTNPDFVHYSMLSRHERWERLWRSLSVIVIDEFHNYRGMFGAHVALVLRRILRLCRHYGARPAVMFLSATSGHPYETARAFLGSAFGEVRCIDEDTSPRGEHHIVLWRSRDVQNNASDVRGDAEDAQTYALSAIVKKGVAKRSAHAEAGELTAKLVERGAKVLTFVRSRAASEAVAKIARQWLDDHTSCDSGYVQSYRGGYLPEERRALEAGLREGHIRALATTNALELGIDISGLDAVVVTGWPGRHASFAQQSGRAGRAGAEGLSVFIGRNNPLDHYLLDNPDVIVDGSETQVFDPLNPHVLTGHLCAASTEVPLSEEDCEVFSLTDTALFDALEEQDLLKRRPRGWFWNMSYGSPHSLVSLRSDMSMVAIVNSEDGNMIGTVDSNRADWTVHPGAVYLHQGERFEVESLTTDLALVRPCEGVPFVTFANDEVNISIEDVIDSVDMGVASWNYGHICVRSRVTSYDIRRESDGMYIGTIPLDMPSHELHTQAVWWCCNEQACHEAGIQVDDLAGALHGAEHTAIAMLPLLATCDRWDIGGLSTRQHADTGLPTVFIYDALPGGSGCARRGFDARHEWARMTAERLHACDCAEGCPACVHSPKCGNNNSPLSKIGAYRLMEMLYQATRSS